MIVIIVCIYQSSSSQSPYEHCVQCSILGTKTNYFGGITHCSGEASQQATEIQKIKGKVRAFGQI